METFYTIPEVAHIYNVHHNTVRGWIKDGRVEACRPGGRLIRISSRSLEMLSIPIRNTPHRR